MSFIVNEEFGNDQDVIFKTPRDLVKRIKGVKSIALKELYGDSLELLVANKERTYVYHYVHNGEVLSDFKIEVNDD